jgi:drug/metabolite transporter (DMT)-like permease
MIATMFMLGKLAHESGVALPEIMFWRQAVTLPILGTYLLSVGGMHRLKTQRIGSHAKRAAMGMTGMLCNFAAVSLLPLAESTTLNFTAPLFAVIIAALVLRDHVGPWRWTAVAFGFAGVLVITQPGHAHIPALGAAAGLVSALFNAVISFQIRDLGRTEEPVRVVFYFALFGTALMTLFLPFYGTPHDAHQWFLLLAVGVTGTIGQLFMTAALRLGPVASVIVMDYSQIIWATLYGLLIWNILPGTSTWIGMPLVVTAGLVIAWREHVLARNYAVTPAENE